MNTPFSLSRDRAALVVIDIQEKLAAAMPEEPGSRAVESAVILARGIRELGLPILVTEQYPQGLGPTVAPLREALASGNGPAPTPLSKMEFDSSAAPGFLPALEKTSAKQVILCGMEAHICVLQTAAGLIAKGYEVWVAEDAVASRRDENRRAAIRLYEHIGATAAPTEAILFLLLGKAGSPEFKVISKLVK